MSNPKAHAGIHNITDLINKQFSNINANENNINTNTQILEYIKLH